MQQMTAPFTKECNIFGVIHKDINKPFCYISKVYILHCTSEMTYSTVLVLIPILIPEAVREMRETMAGKASAETSSMR